MSRDPFETVGAAHREVAREAFAAAFGAGAPDAVTPLKGGVSAASVLRLEAEGRSWMMRVEGPATALLPRNPHQYACARLAAEAGVAPPVRYLDEANGVLVTDFVEQQPLSAFPGGGDALAAALGELLARLQAGPTFPQLVYYPDLLTRMLERLRHDEVFASGALDAHAARLAEIRAACDWDQTPGVPSHNDPNPGNILFDGRRLWLIDWEAGYRNDPLVDAAIVIDALAASPSREATLLTAWSGRAPDAGLRERLALIRPLARLYYAVFLLDASAAMPAFRPLGEAFLRGFLTGCPPQELARAVAAARAV